MSDSLTVRKEDLDTRKALLRVLKTLVRKSDLKKQTQAFDQKLTQQTQAFDQKLGRQKGDILTVLDQRLVQQKEEMLRQMDEKMDAKLETQKEAIIRGVVNDMSDMFMPRMEEHDDRLAHLEHHTVHPPLPTAL